MMRFIYPVLGWIVPILLAPLVYAVSREILNASRRIDDLPPAIKRVAVAIIGTLLVGGLNALGVALPAECYVADTFAFTDVCAKALNGPTVVRGVTAAIAAMIIHTIKKSKPNE